MNKFDACNILNIKGEINPQIVKLAYRQQMAKYHPDRNRAGLEMAQAINEAYEVLKDLEEKIEPTKAYDYSEDLSEAINAIIDLEGIIIEICGSWVWVTGNTYSHKEIFKANGFKFGGAKKAWYFRPESEAGWRGGNYSLNDIRTRHGSHIVQKREKDEKAKISKKG